MPPESAALAEIIPPSLHDNDLLDDAFVLPPSQVLGLESADTGWRATRDGKTVAVLLPVVTGKGYSGDIRLLVGIRADGSVAGVRAVKHAEYPGLGDKIEARKSGWIHEFDDQTLSSVEWKVQRMAETSTSSPARPSPRVQSWGRASGSDLLHGASHGAAGRRQRDADRDTPRRRGTGHRTRSLR